MDWQSWNLRRSESGDLAIKFIDVIKSREEYVEQFKPTKIY